GHRRAPRTVGRTRARLPRARRRARGLPPRQRAGRRGRPDQRRARLGDVDARRSAHRRRPAAGLLPAAHSRARHGQRRRQGAGASLARRDRRHLRPRIRARRVGTGLVSRVRPLQARRDPRRHLLPLPPRTDRRRRLRPHRCGCRTAGRARQLRAEGELMDFGVDSTTEELSGRLLEFMDSHVYPAEPVFHDQLAARTDPWTVPPIVDELKAEARSRGLWNFFLPGPDGGGLTNLQYAPLAEITGRSPELAPVALNCAAPDTGNMEVLHMFGSPDQKRQWLEPLLEGRIRSAFAMTEPDVASSDARNIGTSIERDGDTYVVNGRKWFISGAMNPNCRIFIVMGKTDPDAEPHRQQSMVLVPRDTPGLHVKRGMQVFGYDDSSAGGHAEVVFEIG